MYFRRQTQPRESYPYIFTSDSDVAGSSATKAFVLLSIASKAITYLSAVQKSIYFVRLGQPATEDMHTVLSQTWRI